MATEAQKKALTALYAGYFDRAPDPAGLQFWINQIDNGRAFNTIAADFAASAEATALYPYLTAPDVATSSTFITSVYQNLFNRAPDAEGLAFWKGVLEAKSVSVADMIEAIINGAKDAPTATPATFDKATLDNKVEAGLDFAVDAGNTSGFTYDADAKVAATAAIAGVTNDPATVTAAKAATDAYLTGSATVGQTLTLTANTDGPGSAAPALNTTGTESADTYLGATATLTSADVIDGKGGKDTIEFRDTGTSNVAPKLTSVENIKVTALGGVGGTTFNLVSATGVENVASVASNSNVAFTNVKNVVDLEASNTTAGTIDVTYAASAVTGTADVQDIALNSATTGAITVNGVETANVTSTGANTVAGLVTGAATVNLMGAGSATIGGTLVGATTIDGSKATGALSFGIDAAKDVKAIGGTGDDTITVSGLSAQDDIDAGAGTDFVAFANADVPTSKVTNLKSFEGVQLNAVTTATVGVNVDNFSGSTINQFKIGTGADNGDGVTTGAVNITNGTTGSTITQFDDANIDGSVSFALKTDGAADVLNYNLVNVDTTVAGGNHGLASLTATGIETLNIDASNKVKVGTAYPADTLTVATLNASAATKLNITGTSAVALGTVGSTLTALATVDASAMTKDVTLGSAASAFGTANTGATITTGTGTDAAWLNVGTTGVLKAVDLGSQSTTSTGDTLAITGGGALTGVTVVDLTSTTDQVQQLLGSANSAAQVGIENINANGLTGAVQVTGSATANTIVGTATADTINGGGGNDVITGGAGADAIAGGTGKDTFVLTHGTSIDTISDFLSVDDTFNLDLSELETANQTLAATTIDLVEIHDNNSVTAGASSVQTLTGAATAVDGANVFLLDMGATTYANAAAAVDALETGGAAALSFGGNIAQDDAFVFAYEKTGGGVNIAIANFAAADANGGVAAATGANNLEGADLVTLTGVSDVTTLTAADFAFIA
ncbi:MAG: DUF4214 domain-containing protein [Litorimonas sp.]